MDIEARRKRLKETRATLGIKGVPLARAAQKLADAARAEIKISQQSISHFENSAERKRIPAWLPYVERALEDEAKKQAIAVPSVNEELSELAAMLLAVISKPGSETRQPRELAKILADVATGYFAPDQAPQTKKRAAAPTPRAERQAAARSRAPSS